MRKTIIIILIILCLLSLSCRDLTWVAGRYIPPTRNAMETKQSEDRAKATTVKQTQTMETLAPIFTESANGKQ